VTHPSPRTTPLEPLFPVIRASAHVPPSFPQGCHAHQRNESWMWRVSLPFFYRLRALGVGNREYIADLAEQIRRKRDRALVSAVWSMTIARRRTVIRNGINCIDLSAISLPSVILNHIDYVHPHTDVVDNEIKRSIRRLAKSGSNTKIKRDFNRFKYTSFLIFHR